LEITYENYPLNDLADTANEFAENLSALNLTTTQAYTYDVVSGAGYLVEGIKTLIIK
jgi:hypothetical protein